MSSTGQDAGTMQLAGQRLYADALAALDQTGVRGEFLDIGDGCGALYCRLEGGRYLMITDVADPLAWDRGHQEGWGAGLYLDDGEPDDPISYRYTSGTTVRDLIELVRESLTKRPDY